MSKKVTTYFAKVQLPGARALDCCDPLAAGADGPCDRGLQEQLPNFWQEFYLGFSRRIRC